MRPRRMVAEVCRENGISESTYFNWKSKSGGMTAAAAEAQIPRRRAQRRLHRAIRHQTTKRRKNTINA
ncbi:MAG: hypothetical protein C4324_12080 [Blastocatellia bacterium]